MDVCTGICPISEPPGPNDIIPTPSAPAFVERLIKHVVWFDSLKVPVGPRGLTSGGGPEAEASPGPPPPPRGLCVLRRCSMTRSERPDGIGDGAASHRAHQRDSSAPTCANWDGDGVCACVCVRGTGEKPAAPLEPERYRAPQPARSLSALVPLATHQGLKCHVFFVVFED